MEARKVVIHSPGSYDKLKIETFSLPALSAGEILIEVEAIGINYADCVVRMGLYESAKKYVGWPITPGFEVAGTVKEVGSAVRSVEVGQKVLGVTRFGGYTSHIILTEDLVFPLPKGFSVEEAAGFPSVFLTAYYGMFELANPREGLDVLVHSAAGGVGGALLQLSRVAKCRAVGVVGASHKIETAKELGAVEVIDKSKEDLWKAAEKYAPEGYHLIFDANGVSTLKESYKHLGTPGKLVIYGFHSMLPKTGGRPNWFKLVWDYFRTPRFNPLDMTGANHSILAFNLSYLFEERSLLASSMKDLLGWCKEGQIIPPPVKVYSLEDVAKAHQDLESGQTVGKLVLAP